MVVEPGGWMVNRRPGAEVRAGVGKRRRRAAAGKSVWQLGLAPAGGQSRDRRLPQAALARSASTTTCSKPPRGV